MREGLGVSFLRRILRGREPEDILVGDPVRCDGLKGVWWVREINEDHAIIAKDAEHRAIVPLIILHRLKQRGSIYDRRSFT